MYIKDLHVDVELDSAALAAVRGGCGPAAFCMAVEPKQPTLPTFGGDWAKFNTDVKGYIGDVKAGAGFPGYGMQNPVDVDTNMTVGPPGTEYRNLGDLQ